MVGVGAIGTGFNEKIVTSLLQFVDACYEGLLDKIKKGLEPEMAVEMEFKEIKEYIYLIQGKMVELKESLGK